METKESLSTGQRVWAILAIIFSVLVLLLSAAGTAGTWVGRSAAIKLNDNMMDGIIQLADAGRQASTRLGDGVAEIRTAVVEVESAVDEVSQNVSDKGLILTLLPPEKEEKIISSADKIAETLNTITSAAEAAFDLYTAIDNIPLINLAKPEEAKVQELDASVKEIQSSVEQLATGIQEFRDGAASEVTKISAAAGQVNNRLEVTSNKLDGLESELAIIQTGADSFKGSFRTMVTIAAIVMTLLLIWVIYAMVIVIMKYWTMLQA